MRFDSFAMNQKGNPSLWILFRTALVAAVLLTTAVPSLSLAEKITAFGMPDSRTGNCPTGQQCRPASPGERNQSIGSSGAAGGYSTLGRYVKNYFATGKVSKQGAASGDGTGEEPDWSADVGSDGKDNDDIILFDDVTDYVDSFGGMTGTSGNTILLADSITTGYSPTSSPVSINYVTSTGGFASERYNVAGVDSNRDAARGKWPIPVSPRFDLGLDPFSSAPGPESYKVDFWARGQGRAPLAKAGNSATTAANMGTAFEDSLYTGSRATDGRQKDWTGSSKARGDGAQSTSLSSGRDQGLSNLTLKSLFDSKDEQEKSETNSIIKLILVGVGVFQALILGAIVVRVLIGRGR